MRLLQHAWLLPSVLLCVPSMLPAQSTSGPVPVADLTDDLSSPNAITTPAIGNAYVTVEFMTARIYQNSGWWASIVEKDRQAVVDASLQGSVGNVPISDTRASPSIELRKADIQADFSWRQILVQRLPTTYDRLLLTIRVSKSSKDGLEALLSTFAEISKNVPTLTVTQSTLGITSGAKALADYLFGKHLLEQKLVATIQFPTDGPSLKAGYYAIIAGDNTASYQQYLDTPPPGHSGLSWSGTQLTWDGAPLKKTSYFVLRIAYSTAVFANPLDALSFTTVKPWAALYQVARRKVTQVTTPDNAITLGDEIRAHLINGNALLDVDRDFTQSEREAIADTVRVSIQMRLDTRMKELAAVAPAGQWETLPDGRVRPANKPGVILDRGFDAEAIKTIIRERQLEQSTTLPNQFHP